MSLSLSQSHYASCMHAIILFSCFREYSTVAMSRFHVHMNYNDNFVVEVHVSKYTMYKLLLISGFECIIIGSWLK